MYIILWDICCPFQIFRHDQKSHSSKKLHCRKNSSEFFFFFFVSKMTYEYPLCIGKWFPVFCVQCRMCSFPWTFVSSSSFSSQSIIISLSPALYINKESKDGVNNITKGLTYGNTRALARGGSRVLQIELLFELSRPEKYKLKHLTAKNNVYRMNLLINNYNKTLYMIYFFTKMRKGQ